MRIDKQKNLNDKYVYVLHVRNSKQVLNHSLLLEKVLEVIKFNQVVWFKPYIEMSSGVLKMPKQK